MENEKKQPKVIVFSTLTCPWCVMVKQYLDSHKIVYENKDVSFDHKAASEMIEKTGEMGVPQIWVDDEVVVGFDKDRLNELLGIK